MSTKSLVQVALFAALIAVLAQIAIPLPGGVPITMQLFGIYLAGSLLGAKRGALALLAYLLLGIVGIPVFANGRAGIGVLLGPTGGYLLGFLVGTWVLGWLVERRPQAGYGWMSAAMVVATLIAYTLGTVQFVLITEMPLAAALALTVVPFLPLDLLKILVAAGVAVKARQLLTTAGYLEPPVGKG
ncbi:MAG: biotin transporter BioY [Clostridia bacterium]|nr:biotin transporter BioY [Clostridia bacterium]